MNLVGSTKEGFMEDMYGLKKIFKARYRCFEYCAGCAHRSERHYANCIECCPVRRGDVRQDTKESQATGT